MRTPIALAIYLCVFAAGSLAEGPVAINQNAPASWMKLYEAGVATSRNHSDEEALNLFKRSWDAAATSRQRGFSADGLGQIYRRLGRLRDAEEWLERARQAFSAEPCRGSRLALTASDLADWYRATGDYTSAERVLREAVASPSCDSQSKGLLRNDLAAILREEGRAAEARPMFQLSIDSPAASPRERVGALVGLAAIDREQSHWEASIDRWNEALELCRRERDERTEAIVLLGLGSTWLKSGSAARAEPMLRRSLRMMEGITDMLPEEVATAHSGMAELYRSEDKLALAKEEWSRALEIDRTVLGASHPQVAILMEMLSDVNSAQGQFGIAREYAARALGALRGSFGENSMPAATALSNQASVEERAGDLEAAARDYESAIAIARAHPEHRSLELLMTQRYARLLKTMHRSREAKALLARRDPERDGQALGFPVK